jgi:hypothetical protein
MHYFYGIANGACIAFMGLTAGIAFVSSERLQLAQIVYICTHSKCCPDKATLMLYAKRMALLRGNRDLGKIWLYVQISFCKLKGGRELGD